MTRLSTVKYRQNETLKMETSNSRANNGLKAAKQGIVTDTFINGRDGENSILADTSLPEDLKQPAKTNKNTEKRLLAMVSVPLAVLGGGSLVTGLLSGMYKKRLNPELAQKSSSKLLKPFKNLFKYSEKPPVLPPNNNIETEAQYVTYEALRAPSRRRVLGAMAVYTFSSAAFVLKNTTDGLKEIWVKKKDADIQRDYQEKMIGIETRSFAGKKQVVRHLLDKNEKELNMFNKSKNISFAGNKKESEVPEKSGINPSLLIIGIGATVASVFFIKNTVKNIKKIGTALEAAVNKEKQIFAKSLKGKTDKQFKPDEVVKDLTKREFTNKEAEKVLKDTNFTKETKETVLKKVEENNKKYAQAHEMYGNRDGKPTYFSYLNDIPAHVYNAIIDPDKFKWMIAGGFSLVTGLGYAGAKFVEANKEVQVKKANAETDLDMHDKLVPVELLNFMKKKEIGVKPLVDGYKNLANTGSAKVKELKVKYNGVMDEIKTGPPFIYD